ncbi:MAG: Ig-like domain-containing protein [Bacteroidota bacterium]
MIKKQIWVGWWALVWAMMAMVLMHCAQPLSPTGGPRDQVPPEVVKSQPENQSLDFDGQEVKIYFSEAIRPPAFDKEIFISPLVKRPKILRSDNARRIRIRFEEPLRDSTTYVITLTEVKDLNENNSIAEAYTLAFSTGDQLDSMQIKGRIFSPKGGQGQADMKVLLFDADSAINNQFRGKRPAYITKTDAQGNFEFKYLRNTSFRAFGLIDGGQDNTYNLDTEVIAIAMDSVIQFENDTSVLSTVELFAFLPDQKPPRLLGYNWLNSRTLTARFSENLDLTGLQITIRDTLAGPSQPIRQFSFFEGPKGDAEILIAMPRKQGLYSQLQFANVRDSLGNRLDTMMVVTPRGNRKMESPILEKPTLSVEKAQWEMLLYEAYQPALHRDWIWLTDTSRIDSLQKRFPLRITSNGLRLNIKPTAQLDPEARYILHVDGKFFLDRDSSATDTVYRFALPWFKVEDYGNLSGRVELDSTYEGGPIVLHLLDSKGAIVRTSRDTIFSFPLLEPGDYRFQVIYDTDGNGVLSPGVIFPPKKPEKVLEDSAPVNIRANWDFEDHIVKPQAPKPPAIPGEGAGPPGETPPGVGPPGANPGTRPITPGRPGGN